MIILKYIYNLIQNIIMSSAFASNPLIMLKIFYLNMTAVCWTRKLLINDLLWLISGRIENLQSLIN